MTSEYNRNTISTYTEKELNNIRSQTYLEALESYTRAIQLDPTNALTYVKRGEIYTLLEQYDEALADYSRAIQLDPSLVSVAKDQVTVTFRRLNQQHTLEGKVTVT